MHHALVTSVADVAARRLVGVEEALEGLDENPLGLKLRRVRFSEGACTQLAEQKQWWARHQLIGRVSTPKARYLVLVSGAMNTAKEAVRRILDELPDNASLEDIQYHIYVREKIERGLRDVEAGRVVDQAEAKRRMAKWLGE